MNELLQKHGCANVFNVPEGLRELMSDISREVLRYQPSKMLDFITNYLSVLLITREHGIMAVRILDDLCDCKPSVSEHLLQLGVSKDEADVIAGIIKEEIEKGHGADESVKEMKIMKKVLARYQMDEESTANVCQVARNAYRDYWYRKKMMQKQMEKEPEESWELAAANTLEIYKKTKPTFAELTKATEIIQAAYKGYYVRKRLLRHLKPKPKPKKGPKFDMLGPPVDTAASREISLGPVTNVKVKEDDVNVMFVELATKSLHLNYDPTLTITHVEDIPPVLSARGSRLTSMIQGMEGRKSAVSPVSRVSRIDENVRIHQFEVHSSEAVGGSYAPHAPDRISFADVKIVIPVPAEDETRQIEKPSSSKQYQVQTALTGSVVPLWAKVDAPVDPDEVPEDIQEDLDIHFQGDGDSGSTVTVPSSTVGTPIDSDVDVDVDDALDV